MASWCTVESDPGVFTELVEKMGVKGVQVEELYSLDVAEMERLGKIHGLVFLFKWRQESDDRPTTEHSETDGLFFAHQVITNACATQAILSVLLNNCDIELGETLSEFKSFTGEFPPDMKGLAISNSEQIRNTHNSFARQEPFVVEETKATEKDDVFHFIAYLPYKGKVYELDGLKSGPIMLGESGADDWLAVASAAIQTRIERYATSEIRFNMMAVVKNRKLNCEEQIVTHRARLERVEAALTGGTAAPMETAEGGDAFVLGTSPESLTAQKIAETDSIAELTRTVQAEEDKFARWKLENVRRQHNYIPFVVELLKSLAAKKQLQGIVEKGKEKRTAAAK